MKGILNQEIFKIIHDGIKSVVLQYINYAKLKTQTEIGIEITKSTNN